MGKALMISRRDAGAQSSGNEFLLFGQASTSGTELNSQSQATEGATFSWLRHRIFAGGSGVNTIKFRVNSADGNMLAQNTGTGIGQDITNTDVLSGGEVFNIALSHTGSNPQFAWWVCNVEFASGHGNFHGAARAANSGCACDVASATRYLPLGGGLPDLDGDTTEANQQWKVRGYTSFAALQCRVIANARVNTTTVRNRINGANGGLSLAIGAGATGLFVDTDPADSLSDGDLINASVSLGSGTEDIVFTFVGCTLKSSSNKSEQWAANAAGLVRTGSATADFFPIGGFLDADTGPEGDARITAGFAATVSNVRCYLSANTYSSNGTLKLYKNGSAAITLTLTAGGGAGWYENTSDSIQIDDDDTLSFELDEGGSGSITIRSMGLTFGPAGGAGETVSAPTVTHAYTPNVPTLLFATRVTAIAAEHAYSSPLADVNTGETFVATPAASHTCASPAPVITGPLIVGAPAAVTTHTARTPGVVSPELAFAQWLDTPNTERRWLLELEGFPLAAIPQGVAHMYSGPAYSELAYSEGAGLEEAEVRTFYFADHGWTSLVFSPVSGYWLDLPASIDDGTPALDGFDFIADTKIGEGDLAVTRSGVATRWHPIPRRYALMRGQADANPWTQDSGANSVTGDIRIRVEVAAASYTAGSQTLAAKWGAAGARAVKLLITASGFLQLRWSPNGTTELTATSTVAINLAGGTLVGLGAWLDVNNQAGSWTAGFETSADWTTWAALGANVVGTGGGGGGGGLNAKLGWFGWTAVTTFENWLGRTVQIAETFGTRPPADQGGWSLTQTGSVANPGSYIYNWGAVIAQRGGPDNFNIDFAMPLTIWADDDIPLSQRVPSSTLQQIAGGARDANWQRLAQNLYDNGLGSIYIRMGWEMNGNWYPWRAMNGTTDAQWFGAACRRIIDVMRAARPNNNWKFGICPVKEIPGGTTWLNTIYPGNGYMSFVGVDAYDQWLSGYPMPTSADTPAEMQPYWEQAWASWLGQVNIVRNFAASKGLPICFPEYSTVIAGHRNCGFDNTYFVQQFRNYVADPANNVLWHSWLDNDPVSRASSPTGYVITKVSPPTEFTNASPLYKSLFSGTGSAPATTSIFNSTAAWELGSSDVGTVDFFAGKLYRFELRNGLNGPVVASFNANDGVPSQAQLTSSVTGETWTLNGNCRIVGAEIETVATNTQRRDFDPVTLDRLGLRVESGRENVAQFSADFSNAWWRKRQGATVTASAHPAPDGTFSAMTVADPNTTGWSNIESTELSLPGSQPVCASIFVAKDAIPRTTRFGVLQIQFKDAGGTQVGRIDVAFDSRTGERVAFNTLFGTQDVLEDYDVEDRGAFWRVRLSGRNTNPNAALYSGAFYPAHGAGAAMNAAAMAAGNSATGSMIVWGAQLNAGSHPSSYIPTAGAAVQRGDELATLAGISGGSEGAIYVEFEQDDQTSDGYAAVLRDASGSDRVGVRQLEDRTVYEVVDGGASQCSLEVVSSPVSDIITQANAEIPFASHSNISVQAMGSSSPITSVPETGIHGSTLPNGETLRFGKVADPVGGLFQAFQCQVGSGDPTTSGGKRVEMLSNPHNLVWDQVYWVAFSVYVFDWGTLASNDTALFGSQLHTGSEETVGGPAISLITEQSATGREFHVKARWSPGPAGQFAANAVVTRYTALPIPFGEWANFVFKFRQNTSGNAFLQVWMNGTQIANHTGNLGYDTGFNDYMKFGYYNFGTMNSTPRKVLLRNPNVVHDPTGNTYTLAQITGLLSTGTIQAPSRIVRVAGAYKADSFAANGNGEFYGPNATDFALTDDAGAVPTVDRLMLGSDGANFLNGYVRKVYRLSKRVSDRTLHDIAVDGPEFTVQGSGGIPGVDPNSAIYYDGRMMGDFDIERRIIGRDGIGGTAVVIATGSLNNKDGELDTLTNDYSIAGRAARLYVGPPKSVRADYTLVMSGVVERVWVDQDVMRLQFSDGQARLARMVNITTYTGSGGLEGGADLKGKYRPMAYGKAFNVSPPLVRNDLLIFQVHMGTANDVPAVYDRGISLTKGADYSSQSDMENNAPSAGQYRVWKGGGYFRLGSTPAGTVTADVEGDATGGYITKAGEIVERILEDQALLTGNEIHAGSFTTLNAEVTAPVGIWIGTEGMTIAEAVDDLLASVGAFGGFSRLGQFKVGRITAPASTPLIEFTEEDILAIERIPLPQEVDPLAWRVAVAYQKNYTVQIDLAAAVTAARRSFCAEPFRAEEDSDATQLSRHRLAKEYVNANIGLYRDQADALAEARRLKRLWGVERSMFRVTVPVRAITRDLGDVVLIRHKRYKLQGGKPAVILGHEIRNAVVELTVLV